MTDRSDKLQKLYFRIGEVASIVGVEPHVLRYWESEFRSVRPQKSARGQRIYSRRDVDTLLKVKELLYAHRFTIAGAKRKLREGGVEPALTTTPSTSAAPTDAAQASGVDSANARPSADAEQVRVLRERLLALRIRTSALLEDVEHWGTDEPS